MKANLQNVCLLCIVFFLFSCQEERKANDGVIDVATAMSSPVELKASQFFKSVRYVPLETNDDCLIGWNEQVQIVGNRIVVTTGQNQCFTFDKETGKFIASVGHIGEDPQGYSSVSYWVHQPSGNLYFHGHHNNWIVYDTNGRFIESIPFPFSNEGSVFKSFGHQGSDKYIALIKPMLGSNPDSLYFFSKDNVDTSYAINEATELSFNVDDIEGISVYAGKAGMKQFGPASLRSVVMIIYKNTAYNSISSDGLTHFWNYADKLYFKSLYNDTIYRVEEKALIPDRRFDLGKHHWEYADRFLAESDNKVLLMHIMEQDRLVISRLVQAVFNNEKRTVYTVIYDKESGETYCDLFENGITDDITHFFPLQPLAVSRQGEMTNTLTAGDIAAWFEDNADRVSELPDEVKQLRLIDEEDNPVVVIME